MAELSNGGSGTFAVTGSASTAPCARSRSSSIGSGRDTTARMSLTCCSTLFIGSPPPDRSVRLPGGAGLVPREEVPQPRQELLGQVRALAGELHHGAKVVDLVAGVVALAAEQHAVDGSALGGAAPGEFAE